LRVVLDGRCFQDYSAFRGVGRYGRGILGGFSRLAEPCLEITVALDEGASTRHDALVTPGPDETILGHPTRPARLDVRRRHWAIRGFVLNRSLHRFRGDLLHILAQFHAPYARPIALPYVITVHDLIPFRLPDPQKDPTRLARRLRRLAWVCRRARLVIAVSEHSKRECVEMLDVSPERVVVVPQGVERHFVPTPANDEVVRSRLGVRSPYFLYVGGADAHKNLEGLLEAFRRFRADDADGHELAVVGNPLEGAEPRNPPDRVRFLGFVADEDLPALYRGARAFATLSLHEGFALPVVEAMACGTPVICASNSAFPETVGDAGLMVGATDPQEAARAMCAIVRSSGLAQRLRELGLERAAQYTWDATARGTLDAYRRALADPSPTRGAP
jgi:glycosyltransferase involved in cell wall biosynthesis